MVYSGTAAGFTVPNFKSELLLMPPGTHLIEVGARTDKPVVHLHSGELLLEMTEYDPELHIGLSYPKILHIR